MFEHLFSRDRDKTPSVPAAISEYEKQLRAMPSYELKAEYIIQFGNTWDNLARPKLESAIQALVQRRGQELKMD